MRIDLGAGIKKVRAGMERLEDRLDARFVRMEGHMADTSRRAAHVEGRLGRASNPSPRAKD